jgi:ketosteroid isomerase-like protein
MLTALQTVNEHYRVIIEKDLPSICAKYMPSEETYVVLEGPRLTTIGYEKIKKGWTDFCASSLQLLSIDWTEGPFAEEHETMAWVAGIIKLKIQVGEKQFENIFRSSFVLLRERQSVDSNPLIAPLGGGGAWKIKHEHVSVAHPDPYGIGDWLKK